MSSLAQPTPGEPRPPGGSEPATLAFRRPLDRPAASRPLAAGGADELPVVLRLPDLARREGAPAEAPAEPTSAGPARPWIGWLLWTATGILAVVAAALVLIGKPTSTPMADEAPAWQTETPQFNASQNTTQFGAVGHDSQFVQPGAATSPIDTQGAAGPTPPPTQPYPWAGSSDYPMTTPGGATDTSAANPAAPMAAPGQGTYPDSGYPSTDLPGGPAGGAFPAATAPGAIPGGAGYGPAGIPAGSTGPGGYAPPATAPGGGPQQPPGGPTVPAELNDPAFPGAAPDQTKKLEVHSYQVAGRPQPPAASGAARLDTIQNFETRPGNDSTR